MLDDSAQAVAMGDYQQAVLIHQCGKDDAFPVRHDTPNSIFQGFRTGKFPIWHTGIADIHARITGIIFAYRSGSHVIASSPDVYLFFTILDRCFTLIQSLKHAVMLLVQPPGLFNRNPVFIQPVQDTVQRFYGTFQVRSVSCLKRKSGLP